MPKVILLFILLSSSMLAQINLVVHAGLAAPSTALGNSSNYTFLDDYWSNGIDGTCAVEYQLAKNISIAPTFSYTYYPWDNYDYRGPMIPEFHLRSAQGEKSQIYRFMLEGRFIASHKFILFNADLYFTTGLGYTIEDIGRIRVTVDDMNGPSFVQDIVYPNRSYWIHTLGVGTRADLVGPIALDLSAKYLTDYNQRFYTSVGIGLVYSFSN